MTPSFDRFLSRTWVEGNLVTRTGLSIGDPSGDPLGTDLPLLRMGGAGEGRPFIPGSSFKGVVRSEAERIARTLVGSRDFWSCDILAKPCVNSNKKENLVRESSRSGTFDDDEFTRKVLEKSCTICRLFGNTVFASRLLFSDLLPKGEVTTHIRDGVGINRSTGAAQRNIKYDFEVVAPEQSFGFVIVGENLEEWEVGFLLMVLRGIEQGGAGIGGKRSRGLGWVKFDGLKIRRTTAEDLFDLLLGEPKEVEDRRFIEKFKEYIQEVRKGVSTP